jgi:ParB/RepB/Spo0J family partition protein
MHIEIPLSKLRPGPNVRKVFVNIEALAGTIHVVGLLENLVVVPDPDTPDSYIIRGGERRWRAMRMLVEQRLWDEAHPVACRVLRTSGEMEALADNEGHDPVPPWEAGEAYQKLIDSGCLQEQIARAVGKSQQHISQAIRLYRGIAPPLKTVLNRLGTSAPSLINLEKMAQIVDRDTLKPDPEKQTVWLQEYLCHPKKPSTKRRPSGTVPQILNRLEKLQQMSLPLEHVPVVEAVIRYLTCIDATLTLPPAASSMETN